MLNNSPKEKYSEKRKVSFAFGSHALDLFLYFVQNLVSHTLSSTPQRERKKGIDFDTLEKVFMHLYYKLIIMIIIIMRPI